MVDTNASQTITLQPKWCQAVMPQSLVASAPGQIAHISGALLALRNINKDSELPILISTSSPATNHPTALATCPAAQLLAVALTDAHSSKPSICIFDGKTRIRRKILNYPSNIPVSTAYKSLSFSSDGKYLAALTEVGGPTALQQYLIVWSWEKSKVLATAPATTHSNYTAVQCSFLPEITETVLPTTYQTDEASGDTVAPKAASASHDISAVISVIGKSTCRTFNLEPAGPNWSLKASQVSIGKYLEGDEFTCSAWLDNQSRNSSTEERIMVAGTAEGTLTFIRAGFVRSVVRLGGRIDSVAAVPNCAFGVAVVAAASGKLHFVAPSSANSGSQEATFQAFKSVELPSELAKKSGITLVGIDTSEASSSGDVILCIAAEGVLAKVDLKTALNSSNKDLFVSVLDAHVAPILSVSFCIDRPIAAALSAISSKSSQLKFASLDHSAPYFATSYPGGAVCFDLHPSGHMALVATSREVLLQQILADSTKTIVNFPITGCISCQFTREGHYFAVLTSQGQIKVWSTFTRALIASVDLPERKGRLLSLQWAHNDTELVVTSTMEVYKCSVSGDAPVQRYQVNEEVVAAAAAAVGPGDASSIYAVTASGKIYTFGGSFAVSSDPVAVELPTATSVTAMTVGQAALVLGLSSGAVLPVALPLSTSGLNKNLAKPQKCASGPITSLKIDETKGSLSVLAGANDGSLTLLTSGDSGVLADIGSFGINEDSVLVSRSALNALKVELKSQAFKLETAVEEKTAAFAAETAALTAELETVKTTASRAVGAARNAENAMHAVQTQHEIDLKAGILAAEQAFEKRLGVMEEKLSKQLRDTTAAKEAVERELQQEKEQRQREAAMAFESRTSAIAAAVKELENQLQKAKEQEYAAEARCNALRSTFEAESRALQVEFEERIKSTRAEVEDRLAAESATVQRLRGESALLKQRYEDQRREAENAQLLAKNRAEEAKKLKAQIDGLSHDAGGVKQELAAREKSLQEKESILRSIGEREMQLEKKCEVLKQSAAEAEAQARASATAAADLRKQVESLEKSQRIAEEAKIAADLAASSRKQREAAARKDAEAQREAAERLKRQIRKIKNEITEAAGKIQQPAELKAAVVQLYHTYASDESSRPQAAEGLSGEDGMASAAAAVSEESETLRIAVNRLQRQLKEQRESAEMEKRRLIGENSQLLKEIRRLEEEQKKQKSRSRRGVGVTSASENTRMNS